MKRPLASRWINGRQTPSLAIVAILLFVLLAIIARGRSLAAPTADCSDGNFSGIYEDQDATLSGDLFVTGNVTVRNNITITLEAGTNVTFCGAYRLNVEGGGNLRALGTESAPIIVGADDAAVNWDSIIFSGQANHSVLRHVILNDGGGNDPLATKGAVEFNSTLEATSLPSPTLDHVIINDSGAYGLYLQVDSDDATPPSISDLTVNDSAGGAMLANAQALGGLGSGNTYTNNSPNTIQVIHGGASRLYHSQTWRDQGVPFEMLGTALVAAASNSEPYPTLTIDAGTTFLMHPDARLEIGTSLGRGGSLLARGTASAPIVFRRLSGASAPWDRLRLNLYSGANVDLQYVEFSYGGISGPAAIEQLGEGTLSLDHVTVSNSQTAGLHAQGAVNVSESTFEFNQVGLEFQFMADAVVRNSIIRNNLDAGLRSLDTGSDFTRHCIDAAGNFWGSPDGPADAYDQADGCGKANSNTSDGDAVSGAVLYEPWLPGEEPLLDRGVIQPHPYYVVSDGVDSALVTITLRDATGNPLVGKQVQLESTVGTVAQPTEPTDDAGMTTAAISSTVPGFAYLSAYNLTDDAPVSGLGGVTFWQGSGDAGGLIDPGGAPFASPRLIVSGQPYQTGFPVNMRVPLQNSNPYPVDVQVAYGVSNLAVGAPFAPVYTTTTTLQPGESWDASGVWLPTSTGHRCIQAAITTSDPPTAALQRPLEETTTRQVNTNQDPCDPETLDPGDPFPQLPGGLFRVAGYFYRLYVISKKANECLELRFPPLAGEGGGQRDYQQVVTPPAYDPPQIVAQGDLTPDQVDALNAMAQTTADLLSLNLAMGATAQRLNWAAQAVGVVGAVGGSQPLSLQAEDNLYYLDLQYEAYRDFANRYADKLDIFADQIDDLVAVLGDAADAYFLAEDFQRTRDRLANSGFSDEERTFYQQTGLDNQLIDQLEQDLVANFDNHANESIGFVEALTGIQASSRALATRLRSQYPAPAAGQSLTQAHAAPQSKQVSGQQLAPVFVPPQVFDFDVGHPFASEETVELVVRPISLPLGWTYELSSQSVTLGEGETEQATLTLYPQGELLEGELVQVTVEGYVNGELVGGIQMDYLTPFLVPRSPNLYLPMIVR